MRIIINGMGCPVSGGRLVLEELIKTLPENYSAKVFIPFKPPKKIKKINVEYVYRPHKIWGQFLRPILEIHIYLSIFFGFSEFVINLSNYGFSKRNRSILYFHNPILLDLHRKEGFGNGQGNFLVRFALHSSLKNSKLIIVQTNHVKNLIQNYIDYYGVNLIGEILVVKPSHILSMKKHKPKISSPYFKLFYPAHNFPHKRLDLAISAVHQLKSVKLFLTTNEKRELGNTIFLGHIQYSEVKKHFSNSNALLFTSERETLGLPLLEALEYGLPAVLPNIPYAREIYGESGVYFEDFSINSVMEAIQELIFNYDFYLEKVEEHKLDSLKSRKTWNQHWEIIDKYLF